MKRVLNVGGGSNGDENLPRVFQGWECDVLDIDPNVKPDICWDARKLATLPGSKYDAVFCSHCLEHFHKHEVFSVLSGFGHVLKDVGFANIAVPDVMALCNSLVKDEKQIDDVWYQSPGGPITFHDVMYGWSKQIAGGNLFYCHKTAFTRASLTKALRAARFQTVLVAEDGYNLHAFAFKSKPAKARLAAMGL